MGKKKREEREGGEGWEIRIRGGGEGYLGGKSKKKKKRWGD